MYYTVVANLIFCAFLTVAAGQHVQAATKYADCRSIAELADIRYSAKLIVNITRNNRDKICHFPVSMPPPDADATTELWYKLWPEMVKDPKVARSVIAGIVVALTPEKLVADVVANIQQAVENDSSILDECVSYLVAEKFIENNSTTSEAACRVSTDGKQLVYSTNIAFGVTNLIILPRPT